MVRLLIAVVIAAVVMIVLGSVAHSLFVQEAWSVAAGQGEGVAPVAIPLADRISWIVHDLIGLQPLYGGLTAVALLLGFLAAGLLARVTGLRPIVFAVAGAVAIFVMFSLMKMQLGTVGVFGARGTMGLAAQMGAGLIAGLLFALLTPRRSA
jgi:hypothetical protein